MVHIKKTLKEIKLNVKETFDTDKHVSLDSSWESTGGHCWLSTNYPHT